MGGGDRETAPKLAVFDDVVPEIGGPMDAPNRLAPLPSERYCGDYVVGADQYILVSPLLVADGFNGTVLIGATIYGQSRVSTLSDEVPDALRIRSDASAFLPDTGVGYTSPVELGAHMPFLRVRFRPTSSGRLRELLQLRFVWSDGKVTEKTVVLIANAIARDAVPTENESPPNVASVTSPSEVSEPSNMSTDDALAKVKAQANKARTLTKTIAEYQKIGMEAAQSETVLFVARAPEDPLWFRIAEIVVEIGVAAVASIAAEAVAAKLLHGAMRSAGHDAIKAAEATLKFKGAVEGVKEGFELAGRRAGRVMLEKFAGEADGERSRSSEPSPAQSLEEAQRRAAASSDNVTNFWTAQSMALVELAKTSSLSMDNTEEVMSEMAKSNPSMAAEGMANVEQAIETTAADSPRIVGAQKIASLSEWVTGLNQEGRGVVFRGGREVTEMRHVLHPSADAYEDVGMFNNILILEADAELDSHGELRAASVTSVRFDGISAAALATLSLIPLQSLRIPMMIHVVTKDGGDAMISRDETGYLTYRGNLPTGGLPVAGKSSEADNLMFVSSVFKMLGTKSLSAWKAEIRNNDVGKSASQAT